MRIVSLVPSVTEALCMLGLEDSIVGITDYCVHPAHIANSRKRIGGTKNPRLRDILDLRPDLVIVNTDENRRQTFVELKAAGLSALVTQTDSLDEVEEAWVQLGEATGTMSRAIAYREAIAAARACNYTFMRCMKRLPALMLVWRNPWIASGSGTHMESLLSECGFRNVMASTEEKWVRIRLPGSPSDGALTLRGAPAAVLLPSEPYPFSGTDREELAEFGFAHENIRLVDGLLLSWWLSRTVEALEHFRLVRFTFR